MPEILQVPVNVGHPRPASENVRSALNCPATLLADGSKQANLWGINLRPSFGNRSRGVDDAGTRAAITAFIERIMRR